MLTELQRKKLTYYFHLYDYDHDGYITESDFREIAHNMATQRGWKPGWQVYDAVQTVMLSIWRHVSVFMTADPHTGACLADWMAHEEYMLESPERYEEYAVQMAEGVFAILDEDGDGTIVQENYKNFLKSLRLPEQWGIDAFNRMDADRKGRLTLDEIQRRVYEFHYSDDPDAPGNWLFGPI